MTATGAKRRRAPAGEDESEPARALRPGPSPRKPRKPRTERRRHRRLSVVYDIEGPRIRLGIGWFVVAMVALALGVLAVAVLYGATAAFAAAQTTRAWRRKGVGPDPVVAAVCAAGLPLAAVAGTAVLGAAVLGATAVCILMVPPAWKAPRIVAGARTLQCCIWVGGAAAGVVTAYRFEPWAAVALVLCVSAYETGDYIVGSGASNAFEGPIAGIAAVLVVQFGVSAIGFPPFELPDGLGFAALAAVLCPAGQIVGSLILPSVRAPASALRRLDSLLLLAPCWAWAAGLAVTAQP
jgi:hypothetical protein